MRIRRRLVHLFRAKVCIRPNVVSDVRQVSSSCRGLSCWVRVLNGRLPILLLKHEGSAILLRALPGPDCGPKHRLVTCLTPIIGTCDLQASMIVTRRMAPSWV